VFVLLISRDPNLQRSVSMLNSPNWEVLSREDATAGLQILKRRHVDVVLLDYTHPVNFEPEFILDLRRTQPNLSIVVVTEGGEAVNGPTYLNQGADYRLEKPFKPERLRAVITHVSERHELPDNIFSDRLRYKGLVEYSPLGVFELRNGQFVYANRFFLKITEYDEQEVLGHRLEEFIVPEAQEAILAYLRDTEKGVSTLGPQRCRFRKKNGTTFEARLEVHAADTPDRLLMQGILCDLSEETRLVRLHQTVLEIGEAILAERNIDRILQLVLDAITEQCGFQRAILTLYDLSAPDPLSARSFKHFASGVSEEELEKLRISGGITPEERKLAFAERFRVGSAYHVPDSQVPWNTGKTIPGIGDIGKRGNPGFLFIPLRSERGVIGHISVDDPIDLHVCSVEFLQPIISLANLAALAVERAHQINQLQKQKDRLHGLSQFSRRLAKAVEIPTLCRMAVMHLFRDMNYDYCAIWLREGPRLVLRGMAAKSFFPVAEIPTEGSSTLIEQQTIGKRVMEHGQTVLVPDVTEEEHPDEVPRLFRSSVYVPIVGYEGALGFINVKSVSPDAFSGEDTQILEAIAAEIDIAISNLSLQEDLRQQAIRDPLTGLHNRHYFNELIQKELERADRYQHPVSLMMVDVDGFRVVNNRLGHLKGDKVLRAVAQQLCSEVRSVDHVVRYGGDEFVILMPETDGESEQVARRLKERIANISDHLALEGLRVGLSIGIYTRRPYDPRLPEEILEEADRRMYADKRARYSEDAHEYNH
jgi:diguanylate cyclase (GGDEF)-like protein/PAS domain S-box-containing protein